MKKGEIAHNRHSHDYVNSIFVQKGYVLLDKYEKSSKKLRYICRCGKENNATFMTILYSKGCRDCANKKLKLKYKDIKETFESNGAKLLSNNYINNNTKLEFICKCGNKDSMTFSSYRIHYRCKKCGKKSQIENQKKNFEDIKNFLFKELNCSLLSSREEYKNSKQKLYIKCNNCNKIYFKNWCKISKWIGCYCSRKVKTNEVIETEKFKNFYRSCFSRLNKCFSFSKYDVMKSILGYSLDELKNHIKSNSKWENLKNHKWSIDHIFPIKAFVDYRINDFKIINCLDNLTILSLSENCSKRDIYNKENFENWLRNKGVTFIQPD